MKKKKKKQIDTATESKTPKSTDLFGEDGDDDAVGLKVSETYAKKYNERKDREELAFARKKLADEDIGSSSDETSEDEHAELLTSKVDSKIFETLKKIKSKDPTIYDEKHSFFDDKDFEESAPTASSSSSGKQKKVTYKDFVRDTLLSEGADAIAKEEDALETKEKGKRKKKAMTPLEEQAALKAEIRAAAAEEDDDDDALFTLKQKTADELRQEDEEFKDFTLRKDKEPGAGKDGADDIMANYWKADEDLDEGERFLRDYLLNKGWLETTSLQAPDSSGPFGGHSDDEAEEEHLDDVDEFEKEYNFRFEVEEGRQIQGHARFPEQSVRERPDKRKRLRQEKSERKDAEKIRRTEELKRLKNLKKEEIRRRLKQLQDITGNTEDTALGAVDLDADFDPDQHDVQISKLLGESYDNEEEALGPEELLQAPAGCEADLDVASAGQEVLERRKKKNLTKVGNDDEEEGGDVADEVDVEEEDTAPDLWFRCDACECGIPGGKKRFDCTVCEDYTLCAKCFRVRRHPHKFVRRKVPERCMPPEDYKGKEANREDIANVLDEYFQLDYEDIIGGDLPTRFKYRKVEGNDFGMSPTDILTKSDQELNRIMPLKKLRTYRDEPGSMTKDKRDLKRRQGRGHGQSSGSAGRGSHGMSSQRLSAYNLGENKSKGKKHHKT